MGVFFQNVIPKPFSSGLKKVAATVKSADIHPSNELPKDSVELNATARIEAQKQAILDEGWSRLDRAKTVKEKKQALDGIIAGVEKNDSGACMGISRAIVERLSTRKPAQMSQFSYLNDNVIDDPKYGLVSIRPDKIPQLSMEKYRNNYDGRTESQIYESLPSLRGTSWYRKYEGVRQDLHQSVLDELNIDSSGMRPYKSTKETAEAFRSAGDGALGYIFTKTHVIAAVNIKGDVFALFNHTGPAFTEELSDTVRAIRANGEPVYYGITNNKVKG